MTAAIGRILGCDTAAIVQLTGHGQVIRFRASTGSTFDWISEAADADRVLGWPIRRCGQTAGLFIGTPAGAAPEGGQERLRAGELLALAAIAPLADVQA